MRNVKPVRVGDCVLNGEHIYIQSMLNARSDDIEGSVRQAVELEKAGCDVTLLSIENADHADIHFFQKQIWDEICAFFKTKL